MPRKKKSSTTPVPAETPKRKERPQPPSLPEKIEQVLISGDLTPLTSEERTQYYIAVCKSLGLNPLTQPFGYIQFREREGGPAKLVLYAKKDCTDQLRTLHRIAVESVRHTKADGVYIVSVRVRAPDGRTDESIGVVSLTKWRDNRVVELSGQELANALMRAETKAKRRATLSICGLGILDESEFDTMSHYGVMTPSGRMMYELSSTPAETPEQVAERRIAELRQKIEEQRKPPECDPRKTIFWKQISDTLFYVRGYLDEIRPLLTSKEVMALESDGRWLVEKGAMTLIKEWCATNGHPLKPDTEEKKEAPPQTQESHPGDKEGDSPDAIKDVEVVKKGGKEYRRVLWRGLWHTAWDKKLFPYLDQGRGKSAEFLTIKSGNFSNILRAKRIGETEFDDDGVPVIKREAPKASLFDNVEEQAGEEN